MRRRRAGRLSWSAAALSILLVALAPSIAASPVAAAVVTGHTDAARSGWYPDQPTLTRARVTGGTFGQLFAAPVTGQVYAQPLVSNGVLLVATEGNRVYGLDPETGAQRWTRALGTPFRSSDIGCGDLTPEIGITSTPVIDDAGGGTAYVVVKRYRTGTSGAVMFEMHALDLQSGATKAGWPIELAGTAQNDADYVFPARTEHQRAALLLLDGVVYAAFAGHCDIPPYQGWVMGVATAGTPRITARWVAMGGAGRSGAGIWQSGGGLVSDGSGRIFFGAGNGWSLPDGGAPVAGTAGTDRLGQAVGRLQVQADGTLRIADFFTPYNAANLDGWDADISSGAPLALPPQFGAGTSTPNLLFQVGKQGRIYLIDRDDMGGFRNGEGGGDGVVATIDGNEGVWARAAVWPGDGGHLWVPTASGGASGGGSSGHVVVYKSARVGTTPTLTRVATSSDAWPYASSGPVITSNGTASGSAIAWLVKSTGGSSGTGSQLVAYDATPTSSTISPIWTSGTFTSSKFNPPGVGPNGRIYVGTRDGRVLGFGAPISVPLESTGATFGTQTVGTQSTARTVTLAATGSVTITGISSTASTFTLGTPTPPLPAALTSGGSLTLAVRFAPTAPGPVAASLRVVTDRGTVDFPLTGTGQPADGHLSSSRILIDYGGLSPGERASGSVTFTNDGGSALTFDAVGSPEAPFVVTGAPSVGDTLDPGASTTVRIDFAPTVAGSYADSFTVGAGSAGAAEVGLSGSAAPPGDLEISTHAVDVGAVTIGSSAIGSFQVRNTGGSTLQVTKSKPPSLGQFAAMDPLDEGSVIPAGTTLTLRVRYTPSAVGTASDTWIITATDGSGQQTITLTGRGVIPAPGAGGWTLNGSAAMSGQDLVLTRNVVRQAGSAFWPTPVSTTDLTVSFDAVFGNGPSGTDGLTFGLADPSRGARASSVGAYGGGLGWGGIPGIAIALDTYRNSGDPSANFVGISSARTTTGLAWEATSTTVPKLSGATRRVVVSVVSGLVTVSIDGQQVLQRSTLLPPTAYVGFTAGTGGTRPEDHRIRNVVVTSSAPAPATPTLRVESRVVAPAGSAEAARTFAFSGTCPSVFDTGAIPAGGVADPSLTGAAVGSPCAISEAAPGSGWTTTATVNGGTNTALVVANGRATLPTFALAAGTNVVVVTNTYTPPAPSVPPPSAGGWRLNGASVMQGADLVLTGAVARQAGSAFWPTAVAARDLTIDFDVLSAPGPNGGDGVTFTLADPARGATPTSLGAYGGGLGWAGIPGLAVGLDTYQNTGDPSANFAGIATGRNTTGGLLWAATTTQIGKISGQTRHVRVRVLDGQLTVSVDGVQVLQRSMSIPSQVLLGFTGGTGGIAPDAHTIRNVVILAP